MPEGQGCRVPDQKNSSRIKKELMSPGTKEIIRNQEEAAHLPSFAADTACQVPASYFSIQMLTARVCRCGAVHRGA